MHKERAVIYGIGNLYIEMKERIEERYEVIAKVDRDLSKSDKIVSLKEALLMEHDRILIMMTDIKSCFDVVNRLIKEHNVPSKKICLGINYQQNREWDFLEPTINGDIICMLDDIKIITKNIDEFNNIREIFCSNCYSYSLGDNRGEIVIDIGMNIGGAALFFAKRKKVVKIYAFEPFIETFNQARQNVELNGSVYCNKIECFPYGISNISESRQILYNREMTCGQSTDVVANENARNNYKDWQLISDDNDILVSVEVRDVKDILLQIYELHRQENMILKLDCEGEEYKILERMDEAGLFDRIKVIMLEWHYGGEKRILEVLNRNRYAYWNFKDGNGSAGLVYAIKEAL